MKILILSDMHLGHPASRAPSVLDDLRRLARRYDRVILNGDTLERYEAPGCRSADEKLLADVKEACRCGSGDPELITGNHDPAVSSTDWIYLPSAAALVFHGDCMADWTHPTKKNERILARTLAEEWRKTGGRPEGFVELLARFRPLQRRHYQDHLPLHESRTPLHYAAQIAYPPRKPFDILLYWLRAPRRVSRLAAGFDHPVRYVITGHTHRPGRWAHHGRIVLNTGSLMPLSRPMAAHIEDARVELMPLHALLRRTTTVSVPQSHTAY